MSISERSVTCSFFRNCTHMLTRTQEKQFEDMFLVKTASKGTSLTCCSSTVKLTDKKAKPLDGCFLKIIHISFAINDKMNLQRASWTKNRHICKYFPQIKHYLNVPPKSRFKNIYLFLNMLAVR